MGAEAYGERFGSAFAQHVMREALECGGATALGEDKRYFRPTQPGFKKRSKHVLSSVLVARSEGGETRVAYSRMGAIMAPAFISRLWEPRSQDSAGDAAVSFGWDMAGGIGWNFMQEFTPRSLARKLRGR